MPDGEVQAKILNLLDVLSVQVGATNTKVDSLSTRVDTLSTRVDTLSTRVDTLSTEVGSLRSDLGSLRSETRAGFERVERRIGKLETRFDVSPCLRRGLTSLRRGR
jgi:outer membrane murein-binding lipoprotein Lpp